MTHEGKAGKAGSSEHAQPVVVPDELTLQRGKLPQRFGSMRPIDLGEQVVGSRHTFPIAPPVNIDASSGPAQVQVETVGVPEVTSPEYALVAHPFAIAEPILLRFEPNRSGDYASTLKVIGRWQDGHAEHVDVPVRGGARRLDEQPKRAIAARPGASPVPARRGGGDTVDPEYDAAFKTSGVQLERAMWATIDAQSRAVDDVKEEVNRYARLEAPRSVWWDIAELAIVMGTAGLAASLAKFGASQVFKILEEEATPVLKTTGAAASEAVGSALNAGAGEALSAEGVVFDTVVEHAERRGAEHAVKAAAEHAGHDGAGLVEEGLATAIEDGLKHPVEKAMEGMGEGGEEHAVGERGSESSNSADGDINFFSAQRDILGDAAQDSPLFAMHIQEAFRPMLKADPKAANAAIERLVHVVNSAKPLAKKEQAAATAAQFVTYRSRAALGAKEHHGVETTVMEGALRYDKVTAPKQVDGLLDIMIEVNGAEVQVTGARMNGVSSLVANRLLGQDLVRAKVPVRFVIGHESGFITRDEAGRVRASGFVHLDRDSVAGFDEVQEIRGAERIVETVLGRSLREWGVSRVKTDDANAKEHE